MEMTLSFKNSVKVMFEFRVPYSQRYLVVGLVGLIELVGLELPLLLRLVLVGLTLWLVAGIALNN